ncbi:transketolase family protein [Desnuesiella massiliensis]|uniref:transketolase family protein n=1 Tax=Desnuesiella massiliensis TaxID=1650662 RepID=UPI0006E2CFAF|nr:transketolase family protein [Desnuesiella massiliensis]
MAKYMAPRDTFGKALAEIGEYNDKLYVLNADLAAATKTDIFAKRFPDRYLNVGISEQNMVGIAAGLARTGFTAVMSTFACFAPGRCYDQIRQSIAYSNLNVKIMSTHPGLSVGMDGAIHQCLDDIALMRELPNFTVLTPSDEVETRKAVEKAIEHKGPVYVRIGRMECPILFKEQWEYEIGRFYTLKEGKDITFIAHGSMVSRAYEASLKLEEKGVSARVLIASSIKPMDEDAIIMASKETGRIVTAEDHFLSGGLFSSVAETVSKNHPCFLEGVAVEDSFGESGQPEELYEKYGLTVDKILDKAYKLLSL